MRRRLAADWKFPFPLPGRPKARALPSRSESRWPGPDPAVLDGGEIPARHVPAPVDAKTFVEELLGFCDDVGLVSIDDPALAHERDEILYVFPHARTLVCLIAEENKAALQSRYLPAANHELYGCEERLFEMGHRAIRVVNRLGGEGLTTTVGWPQEVSQRWADKIWPLSHKLVAQAAGLGVIGTSRNFLHRRFGAYCLIDTLLTNLTFDDADYGRPIEWNPCTECNLCVASCPTEAIKSDGEFDFFACYNHTYRDSIPGFLDLMRDLGAARPRRFGKRWSDAELAALWQSMAFKVEYRCFNCVATCPAEIHGVFHDDREVRRDYVAHTLKPLTHTRSVADERFVIDTPSAREALDIPPGEWRTPPDTARPGARGVRLVPLQRIRVSNVDSLLRNLPHYFRSSEAKGVEFTCQLDFTGEGEGPFVLRVADQRCRVETGIAERPDLTLRCAGEVFLRIHRGETRAVWELLRRRLVLKGELRWFRLFPALFPTAAPESWWHRLLWRARRARNPATRRSS